MGNVKLYRLKVDTKVESLNRVMTAGTLAKYDHPSSPGMIVLISARWAQGDRWRLAFRQDLWEEVS